MSVGLKDECAELRSAVNDTLLDFKDNAEIARYLLVTVNKETRRGTVNQKTLPLLGVLLASKLPDVDRDVGAYLDKQAGTHDGLILVESLADELGEHGQVAGRRPAHEARGAQNIPRTVLAVLCHRTRADENQRPEVIGQLVAVLENNPV